MRESSMRAGWRRPAAKRWRGGRAQRRVPRIGVAFLLAVLGGCGAQDLYEPPTAPWSVAGRLPLPSRVEDVSVLGDVAYIAAGQSGLIIVDISQPSAPRVLRMLDTVKYAESIRVASTLAAGAVTDIAFVVEGTEGITTYDVTDPAGAFSFQQGTTAVDGNGLFVELPPDPSQPYIVYLAENWKGLRIFESDPVTPGLLRYNGVFADTRGFAKAVTVRDGFAFVADDELGLAVLDVRTRILGSVVLVSACDTAGNALGIDMDGDHVILADGDLGLVVMEVPMAGDPPVPTPAIVGQIALPGRSRAVACRDGIAAVAAQDGGVHFVDVRNPAAPQLLGTVITTYATGVAISKSGTVVVSDRDEGLLVLTGGGPFSDRTPPAPVTDLSAQPQSGTSVRLDWTAPGDDGFSGTAARYDIRYARAPIDTLPAFEAATPVANVPAPLTRGSAETILVGGLEPGTEYFFALRTADQAGNWAQLSNGAAARTPSGNVPPVLRDGGVSPAAGTIDSTFVFEVTYQDGDGDAPTIAEVTIGFTPYPMTLVGGSYETGALFRYSTQLPAGTYDHNFTFSDGVNPPVSTAPVRRPLVGIILFAMGSPADEPGRDTDETLHTVVLTRDVEIADHEVTQAEYEAIMGVNPSRIVGPDLPVHNVTWFDAVLYCNARSANEGFTPAYTIDGETVTWNPDADGYRLPTEAEWEAACRAGTTTAFAGGPLTEEACGLDPVLDTLGWYCGNAAATPHAVGLKQPNARDLYDMHGNVWEWCWDRYAFDLGTGFQIDPTGPTAGTQRTIRGGSWYYFARDCRSAARAPYWPNSADDIVGFRVARTQP